MLLDASSYGTTPPPREGAGFWIRALARGIDTLVHCAVAVAAAVAAVILLAIVSALQGVAPDASMARLSATTPLGFLAALIGATAMHTLGEGLHGSTVGKRICGLTVISEDGGPATLRGAFRRSIAYNVDALLFGLVAARKMSESPRRQRHGDLWGETQVVRLSSLDIGVRRSWLRFALAATAGATVDGIVILVELASRLP